MFETDMTHMITTDFQIGFKYYDPTVEIDED